MTDIVVTTCDRLDYLRRTLSVIWVRTRTSYRLHVIDDASRRDTGDYLLNQQRDGRIQGLLLRHYRRGIPANVIDACCMTRSDPYVFCDDDVLCPDLDPDWLARGLDVMDRYPTLGLLALNEVGSTRDTRRSDLPEQPWPDVTLCKRLGGQFLFVRRAVMDGIVEEMVAGQSPVKNLAQESARRGWQVGYLSNVYCYHFGVQSARMGQDMSAYLLKPADMRTLEPPR